MVGTCHDIKLNSWFLSSVCMQALYKYFMPISIFIGYICGMYIWSKIYVYLIYVCLRLYIWLSTCRFEENLYLLEVLLLESRRTDVDPGVDLLGRAWPAGGDVRHRRRRSGWWVPVRLAEKYGLALPSCGIAAAGVAAADARRSGAAAAPGDVVLLRRRRRVAELDRSLGRGTGDGEDDEDGCCRCWGQLSRTRANHFLILLNHFNRERKSVKVYCTKHKSTRLKSRVQSKIVHHWRYRRIVTNQFMLGKLKTFSDFSTTRGLISRQTSESRTRQVWQHFSRYQKSNLWSLSKKKKKKNRILPLSTTPHPWLNHFNTTIPSNIIRILLKN